MIAGAAIVSALLVWQLAHLLLLVFGAILIGLLLSAIADGFKRVTGASRGIALSLSILFVILAVIGFFYFMGSQLTSEVASLVQRVPDFATIIEKYTGIDDFESWIGGHVKSLLGGGAFLGNITGFSAGLVSVSVNAVLVISGAIYFAISPGIYRNGFLLLIPEKARERTGEILSEIAVTLKHWFIGQLVSMVVIGVITTVGLLLLGIPSAFALGFLAGALEFVPYVGPIASAIPAIAVGLSEGSWTGLWVLLLYVAIQQAESILLTPLVQRQAVDLPPGLLIFSILGFGILFGLSGVMLGTPLTVVAVIVARSLIEERDRRKTA